MVKCDTCGRTSVTAGDGTLCRTMKLGGGKCTGVFAFYTPELDDLDQAQCLLDRSSDVAIDNQVIAYSLAAQAHIAMWWAKQHRDYRRAMDEYRQQAQQLPPQPPMPYQGF